MTLFTDKKCMVSSFIRPQSRPSAGVPRLSGDASQIPVPVHVVHQVHQSDLRSSPRLPDTSDQRPDFIFHPSKNMFNSCTDPGFLSIPQSLKFTQRMISIRLPMNMAFQFSFLQKLFRLFRTMGAIRPNTRSRIVFIKDVLHLLAVMNTRRCHRIFTDKLSFNIHVHMILVAIKRLVVLLCPTSIKVFLAKFCRGVNPLFRCRSLRNLLILIPAVPLTRYFHKGCIYDLPLLRLVTSIGR